MNIHFSNLSRWYSERRRTVQDNPWILPSFCYIPSTIIKPMPSSSELIYLYPWVINNVYIKSGIKTTLGFTIILFGVSTTTAPVLYILHKKIPKILKTFQK